MELLQPPKFVAGEQVNLVQNWKEFKDEFENYIQAVDKSDAAQPQIIALLYFERKKFRKGYITEFQQRKQGPHETVSQYITILKDLAIHCEFGAGHDDQLCVAISNGVRDVKLRDKLWNEDLSLDDIISKCQRYEQQQRTHSLYMNTGATSAPPTGEVHAV